MKNQLENLKILTKLITSSIKNREDKKNKWAKFKKENQEDLSRCLGLQGHGDIVRNLLSFDIDEDEELILLNYTSQAHNLLHKIEGGWSQELRLARGLVFSFKGKSIDLVSRGFEKFFNSGELPENDIDVLKNKYPGEHPTFEKYDGHMIEFFEWSDEVKATTRGKFGTESSVRALQVLSSDKWFHIKDLLSQSGINLMSLVCELVCPETEVLVDYEGVTKLYIIGAYDIDGNEINYKLLSDMLSDKICHKTFEIAKVKEYSVAGLNKEISRKDVDNKEGYVILFPDGTRIKFKYTNYIGRMVKEKLSYRYLMNQIINKRHEKMITTLKPDDLEYARSLIENINKVSKECDTWNTYKPLYRLWSDEEGGKPYFQTVCRNFYRKVIKNQTH